MDKILSNVYLYELQNKQNKLRIWISQWYRITDQIKSDLDVCLFIVLGNIGMG